MLGAAFTAFGPIWQPQSPEMAQGRWPPVEEGVALRWQQSPRGSNRCAMSFPNMAAPRRRPKGVTIHLVVEDADTWWERALAAGASVTMPIGDQFSGEGYGRLLGPLGIPGLSRRPSSADWTFLHHRWAPQREAP